MEDELKLQKTVVDAITKERDMLASERDQYSTKLVRIHKEPVKLIFLT